jgi:glycosyltransferase involved in cell wall biosynthesis
MKILLIGFKLSIGNQLMIETLAEAMQRQGHEVVGIGDSGYQSPSFFTFHSVTDGHSYGSVALQTVNVPLWLRVVRLVKRESADLCYFISSHSLNGPLMGLLRRELDRPLLVSHIHDPIPHSSSPVAIWISLSQWLQVRFSDRVAVYGERLKDLCASHNRYPREQIVVIPHGAYRPIRHAQPDPTPPLWFALLGRIRAYKGIDVFLEAARIVLQSRPDARFFVGGDGDLRSYTTQIQQLGDCVVIQNGTLSNEDIDRITQQSWAVVLPYRDGTQSGVIPVAYYNACPVIVSDVGSLPELVTPETGGVTPPNDAGRLAEAMLGWMELERRSEAGRAAFRFYRQHLVWDDILAEFLQNVFESAHA